MAPSVLQKILDGKLQIQTGSKEFIQYKNTIEFYHPETIRLLWYNAEHVYANAKWRLFRKDPSAPGGRVLQWSQPITILPSVVGKKVSFTIDLPQKVPYKNDSGKPVEYLVDIEGRLKADTSKRKHSPSVLLVQQPFSSMVQPARRNPFACSGRIDYERTITLRLQSILALNNTTTTNEGKDEVYFKIHGISRTENGIKSGSIEHQPNEPPESMQQVINGAKDHFSVEEGKAVQIGALLDMLDNSALKQFVNQKDIERVSQLAKFNLSHGEAVYVTVNIQESDNKALAGVKVALQALAKAASTIAGAFGQVYITAGIEAFDATVIQAIPPIDKDDFLGTFSVAFDNQCGFIRTTWVAPHKIDSQGSSNVKQKFLVISPSGSSQQLNPLVSSASVFPTVMYADDPQQTKFNPYGWANYDFGVFVTPSQLWHKKNMNWNKVDMILDTHGTSNSYYQFTLRAFTTMTD